MAAGLEAVRVYEDEGLIDRAATLGATLAREVAAMQDRHPALLPRTRSLGLLAGLEIGGDAARFTRLTRELESRYVSAHPNARVRTLIVSPPLVIGQDAMLDGLARIEAALVASG